MPPWQAGVALVTAVAAGWFVLGPGSRTDDEAAFPREITEAIADYRRAKSTGTQAQQCQQAGDIVRAFERLQDEAHAKQWKQNVELDCERGPSP